jgi:hypothetical protein
MSARPVTVVVAVALLSAVFGSNVAVVTVAVFDRLVPLAVFAAGVTTIVTAGAAVATAMDARVQVMVVVPVQDQPVPVAETRVVPAGIVSLTLMPVAAEPVEAVLLFVTVIV